MLNNSEHFHPKKHPLIAGVFLWTNPQRTSVQDKTEKHRENGKNKKREGTAEPQSNQTAPQRHTNGTSADLVVGEGFEPPKGKP